MAAASILTGLRSQMFLFTRSPRLWALFVLPAAAAAFRIVLGYLKEVSRSVRGVLQGGADAALRQADTAYGAFADGLKSGWTVAYLLFTAWAAYSLAFRLEAGTLRHALIRRVSRRELVIAECIFLHLLAALSLLSVATVSAFSAAWFYDFGPVLEDGYEIIGVAEIHRELRAGILLATAPLPAALTFGLACGVCARSAVEALLAACGLTLFVDLFKNQLGGPACFLPQYFQPALTDHSYLGEVCRLVRGFSDVVVEEGLQRLNLLSPLPWTAFFLLLALAAVQWRRM